MERTRWPGIYRRGESWVAVVGYSVGGKRRQKWITGATLKAVQQARRDFLAAISKGMRPEDATMSVRDLSELWLDDVAATRRPATEVRYRKALMNHVLPTFGGTRLKDLDRDDLKTFSREHPYDYSVLSALLGYAVKDSAILAANPCSSIRRPRLERREARHLDVDEARRMLKVVRGGRLEGAVVLGLVGGLRLAEVCGLRWRDVDDRVWVRGSFYGPTKSGEVRSLTMPAEATASLKRYKARQAEDLLRFGMGQDESTPVLATWDGRPMSPDTLSMHFKRFTEAHGFDITFHGLRHTAAIAMLSSGVDVKTAASRLGDSPRVLLATYAHHVRSADEAAAAKLGEWLGG